jgi:CBS domain-containing protein
MREVIEGLHAADSIDRLKRAGDDIRRLTQNLLAQGVGAEPLTRTIAALNDALSRRAIDLVRERHRLGDIDWCWLALGSEGRGEQTFTTDQDNALLFVAPDGAEPQLGVSGLLAFARDVNASLDRLGFPLCTGNVMASNPSSACRRTEWKEKFLSGSRAHAAGAAECEHRFRLSRALTATRRSATDCANGCSATRRRTRCSCGSWCRTRSRRTPRSA